VYIHVLDPIWHQIPQSGTLANERDSCFYANPSVDDYILEIKSRNTLPHMSLILPIGNKVSQRNKQNFSERIQDEIDCFSFKSIKSNCCQLFLQIKNLIKVLGFNISLTD